MARQVGSLQVRFRLGIIRQDHSNRQGRDEPGKSAQLISDQQGLWPSTGIPKIIAQAETEGPRVSLNEASGPMGRGVGGGPR